MARSVALPDASHTASELLERARELAVLGEYLETVRQDSLGRVVLVGGEAGVGKTALVRRFCEQAEPPTRILWGGCDPLFTPRPLGPLFALAEGAGGELEQVVASGVRPHEVVAAIVRDLQARSPSIFVLEDVHWADEATLDVLRLLSRRVETLPALIVATYRDDELDRAHPLRIMIGELATSQAVRRVKLAPLSPDAVAQLAEPYAVDADELYRKTGGNPFFVIEALAARAEVIPETVRDSVLARAERLSPSAKRLLEAVALVPPRAELWLLDAMAGEDVDAVEECLMSGMLMSEPAGIAFRHELARLAVEDSVAPNRRVDVHRKALSALADPPGTHPDLARLAHHADAAGDGDAVLRFAPAAAARAASLGSHREASAQYARALRFADRLPPADRAELLEQRSEECFLTDQYDDGIDALERSAELRRSLGDRLREGDDLRRLSDFLWCPGRVEEAEQAGRQAVALLERLPPGRELAWAYANLETLCASGSRAEEAIAWGKRALELAEHLDETAIVVRAVSMMAAAGGSDDLDQGLDIARRSGLGDELGRAYIPLAAVLVETRRYADARKYLEEGIAYCSDRGLELFRLYLLAFRARMELDLGHWPEAADSAAAVLRIPRTSTTPRILSLVVLALLRARRGDPGVPEALEEAWSLAEPTGELGRLGPVAATRAEAAWLERDPAAVGRATDDALDLAVELGDPWLSGELAVWRRRAGFDGDIPSGVAEPYALELAGEPLRAAALWTEFGCPYDAALALAGADAEEPLRRAHADLQRMGAHPAAAIVARRLRKRGARGMPRGPRPATQENPAGLTGRELEVLALVADGLRNAEIADRLVLARKTVDHHVSAILRKLGARSRGQASAEAVKLGLTGQER